MEPEAADDFHVGHLESDVLRFCRAAGGVCGFQILGAVVAGDPLRWNHRGVRVFLKLRRGLVGGPTWMEPA